MRISITGKRRKKSMKNNQHFELSNPILLNANNIAHYMNPEILLFVNQFMKKDIQVSSD